MFPKEKVPTDTAAGDVDDSAAPTPASRYEEEGEPDNIEDDEDSDDDDSDEDDD